MSSVRAGDPGCGDHMPLLQKLARTATGCPGRRFATNRNTTKHHKRDGHSTSCDGITVDVLDRLDPGNLFGIRGATGNPQ
jgi:hypothetical protein